MKTGIKKYTYETNVSKGKTLRFRCWTENFLDEGTAKLIPIKRRKLIKVDGVRVCWNPILKTSIYNKYIGEL